MNTTERTCEFCGCNTNALVRACCQRGADFDAARAEKRLSDAHCTPLASHAIRARTASTSRG